MEETMKEQARNCVFAIETNLACLLRRIVGNEEATEIANAIGRSTETLKTLLTSKEEE